MKAIAKRGRLLRAKSEVESCALFVPEGAPGQVALGSQSWGVAGDVDRARISDGCGVFKELWDLILEGDHRKVTVVILVDDD